jgi:hypothetical protein
MDDIRGKMAHKRSYMQCALKLGEKFIGTKEIKKKY